MRAESRTMVTSLRRREEWLGRISCRIERCEAASQEALSRPSPPCVSSRQHVPKGTSCCSACIYPAAVPAHQCSRHPSTRQPVVHHEGLAGPGGWQQPRSYPCHGAVRVGFVARRSSMCPDRLILYTKCALTCLQGLSGRESYWNSSKGTPGVP